MVHHIKLFLLLVPSMLLACKSLTNLLHYHPILWTRQALTKHPVVPLLIRANISANFQFASMKEMENLTDHGSFPDANTGAMPRGNIDAEAILPFKNPKL